jgi:hypothetical protein
MNHLPGILALVAAALVLNGCAGPRESRRPEIYRGGQDYETAVHADDLAKPQRRHR